ncbi:hypothetical protein EV421DRAFT_1954561 [Armillaria borealis]|uniref:Uncharacterized protein n=1 Tax=Armillaria borealis TaxID=47425 RepID=A0AA39N0L8_9AGAR|nr:hypothetical protein EV421DRAFT_1954561 [Armillaria borealis]
MSITGCYILEGICKALDGLHVVSVVKTGGGKMSYFYGYIIALQELAKVDQSHPLDHEGREGGEGERVGGGERGLVALTGPLAHWHSHHEVEVNKTKLINDANAVQGCTFVDHRVTPAQPPPRVLGYVHDGACDGIVATVVSNQRYLSIVKQRHLFF